MTVKFDTGRVVCTTNFKNTVGEPTWLAIMSDVVRRHSSGDWGDLTEEDRQSNEDALKNGERLMSVYTTDNNVKLWVITEWDRSVTTVLLPEDY